MDAVYKRPGHPTLTVPPSGVESTPWYLGLLFLQAIARLHFPDFLAVGGHMTVFWPMEFERK